MQPAAQADVRNPWKPLVVCPNAVMAARIRASLAERGVPDVSFVDQYPETSLVPALVARNSPDICFLDVASGPDRALPLITEIARAIPVVALNPGNDADLILRCLRLGACEFLSDATPDQVSGVLARLTRLHPVAETARNALVCCVVPGKPGCGASTLATYLAIEMHRIGMSRVLLVDTDSVASSIGFLLKQKSDFHLGDAVRDWQRLDHDLWSRLVVRSHGVDVLLAPENPAARLPMDAQVTTGLLSFWRKHYDAIVLDLPGAWSAGFDFAAQCDELLLVTTNELAALHSTRRTMEFLAHVPVEKSHIKLVVNRYLASTGLKREDVQTALRLEPFALLSNDYDAVQAAILDGTPVAAGSYLGRSINALAERLAGKEKPAKKRSSLFHLLPRRG